MAAKTNGVMTVEHPVEYDPQYILMVNELKKIFSHKGWNGIAYKGLCKSC